MIQQKIERRLESLPAGTVVSVSHGLYRHVGIIAEESFYSERRVLAFCKRQFFPLISPSIP